MRNWDRLQDARPVDRRTAAGVSRDRAPEYDPESYIAREKHLIRSFAPLPMRTLAQQCQPGFVDLTGMVVGRLTVLGLFSEPANNRGGPKWVVRCVCGYYETRRSKALRDPDYGARAACSVCDYTRRVLNGEAPARSIVPFVPTPPAPLVKKKTEPAPIMRLYDAVVRGSEDSTLRELATTASVPREKVREYLDALVKCGALRMRPDGWYCRGILTTRRP